MVCFQKYKRMELIRKVYIIRPFIEHKNLNHNTIYLIGTCKISFTIIVFSCYNLFIKLV